MTARILSLLIATAWLTACGNTHVEFLFVSIGGTVHGLGPGLFLRISNNGSDFLTINAPGGFTFPSTTASGATYNISVTTQPVGERCTVANGTGTATADVSSVTINCVALQAAAADAPGARALAVSWRDDSGNLWLFGGTGLDAAGRQGRFNDLWRLAPGTAQWLRISGSDRTDTSSVCGIRGVPAPNNVPAARSEAAAWTDGSGDFWIFGGVSIDAAGHEAMLDDLWQFSRATGQWTWMGGSSSDPSADLAGINGPTPHARAGAVAWSDGAGDLWLYGGGYFDSNGELVALDDLWRYSPASGAWSAVTSSAR